MIIACDRETMKSEGRVALLPNGTRELRDSGAKVLVAQSAGRKSGCNDAAYKNNGATITTRENVWHNADLIVRVKQPLSEDFKYFRIGLMIACFGHLAANLPLMECALNTGVTLLDYGTIRRADGSLHVLAEMSKLAGRSAVLDGEYLLEKYRGKILMPGVRVAIIGMGNAGIAAAQKTIPTGARLYCFDKYQQALGRAEALLHDIIYQTQDFYRKFFGDSHELYQQIHFFTYDQENPNDQSRLAAILFHADLLIGCTQQFAQHTGWPVPAWIMAKMPKNSVAEDISIDQGGCFGTSQEFFKHKKQTFRANGVIHRCVPNIPGKIPSIATPALCRETLPYFREIAQKGFARAVRENPALASGVVIHKGYVTCKALAEDPAVNRMDRYKPLEEVL